MFYQKGAMVDKPLSDNRTSIMIAFESLKSMIDDILCADLNKNFSDVDGFTYKLAKMYQEKRGGLQHLFFVLLLLFLFFIMFVLFFLLFLSSCCSCWRSCSYCYMYTCSDSNSCYFVLFTFIYVYQFSFLFLFSVAFLYVF